MADPVSMQSRQLLAFGFDADGAFEGQLVGALERLESGGALRILDVLFVAATRPQERSLAIDLQGGTGGLIAKLLDFRLDPRCAAPCNRAALDDDASAGTARCCAISARP